MVSMESSSSCAAAAIAVDGAVEGRLVALRGLGRAAQLAHELKRGVADLVIGRRRIEIEQRS